MTTRLQLAELSYPQAEAVRQQEPRVVLLLPVGALEAHGPHAPLGTDTIISTELCLRAAATLRHDPAARAQVLPAITYGVTHCSEGFAGTVSLTAQTLEALVVEICESLREQGFGRVVIVNSHFEPEHVAALRQAAERSGVALLDLTRRRTAEQLTAEFISGAAHAGRYEGSLLLAARPDLVDTDAMAELPALAVNIPAELAEGRRTFTDMGMDRAYCGAPAEASASEGEETFSTLISLLIALIKEQANG
ncbi:MAG TPA: creatininase family protein [Candidatus Dormibacteraeota bacterium]|nr:creatininase family protein [Candidatus Dormibacteraeota bacterium]